jgi:alkanesulfonate monooxygenase SsuD/methylene tetrahydromethanopterin reductase-like flavin-dependent oxidoreductase (luciferase family)
MAAAVQTSTIGLGTGIAITYPRHPLTLANEALAMAELAPGRFRLGVGASHKPAIEGQYGLDFAKPVGHTREYITILRGLLWEGRVDFRGEYYRVQAEYPSVIEPPRIPIVLATLRRNMLRLAGELSDGAILIYATPAYIRSIALPALEEGARLAQRPRPPLIVSAPILPTTDFGKVREIALAGIAAYSQYPTYAKMFQEGGYARTPDGKLADETIHELYVYGDEDTIRRRLYALYEAGADEILTGIWPLKNTDHEEQVILDILGNL